MEVINDWESLWGADFENFTKATMRTQSYEFDSNIATACTKFASSDPFDHVYELQGVTRLYLPLLWIWWDVTRQGVGWKGSWLAIVWRDKVFPMLIKFNFYDLLNFVVWKSKKLKWKVVDQEKIFFSKDERKITKRSQEKNKRSKILGLSK